MFGSVDAKIGITNVRCRGTEADFSTCDYDVSSACRSQQYASVYCSNDPIQEERTFLSLLAGSCAGYCDLCGCVGGICG